MPSEPKNLSVSPGNRQLILSWEEPDDLGGGMTGYEVQHKKADDSNASWTTSNASVTSDTDSRDQRHHIQRDCHRPGLQHQVRHPRQGSQLHNGDRRRRLQLGGEYAGTTIPDAPTSLAAESGNRQLTLSWEKPSNLGSVSITGYVVQYRKTSETNWTTSTATNRESTDSQTSVTTFSNTITGLDYSTDYDLRVRADNDC